MILSRLRGRTWAARAGLAVLSVVGHATLLLAAENEPTLPPGIDQIVFATRAYGPDGHYYANFGHYCFDPHQKVYPQGGGGLWRLNLRTGERTPLVHDPAGGVRDPRIHYDAQKILFSYRPGSSHHYHLYEIQLDGSALRQLTDGDEDDIEPTYLPDGGIAFCSSRCRRWVMCWKTLVAVLYRCDADGANMRPLSSNTSTENTPAVLPDGRILYTRWEYVDRSQLCYHHLWTMQPDGSQTMVFFGNMHPTGMPYNVTAREGNVVGYGNVPGGPAMLDARPIPGTHEIVAIFSPGHGRSEHEGFVTIIDPRSGPDHQPAAVQIHPDGNWRDPWPLDARTFLVARGRQLCVMDRQGRTRVVYELADDPPELRMHEPVPVVRQPREPVIPRRVDTTATTGTLVLADAHVGRNMQGVQNGEVRRLLVLEQLPGPFHNSPGFDGISLWGTFTLTRILGTVPVESDGSAHFEVPALRSLFFVALDDNGLAVKKMQSFVTLQPGEVTSCVGCHEHRGTMAGSPPGGTLLALRRPASTLEPIPDQPEIVDFRRHVQPILDRHCTECHGGQRQEAELSLDAQQQLPSHGRGRVLSSYVALVQRYGEVADGRNAHGNRPPRALGSAASQLMRRIDGSHYGVTVTPHEFATIRLWLDTGAAANGTYAMMDGGTPDQPSPLYIREMQRYGILPSDFQAPEWGTFDAYSVDQAYWQSLWWTPRANPPR